MVDFANQIEINDVDISIVCETWQDKFDKLTFEQIHGVTWIQNSRPNNRQGGGTAVVCSNKFADIIERKVDKPEGLEITWTTVLPHNTEVKIHVAAFYCSDNDEFKRPKNEMQSHILEQADQLLDDDPDCFVLVAGDTNSEKLTWVAEMNGFAHTIDKPTKMEPSPKKLDQAVTNLPWNRDCVTLSGLAPDSTDEGKPSDHLIAITSYTVEKGKKTRGGGTKLVRQVKKKSISEYTRRMATYPWYTLMRHKTVNALSLIHNSEPTRPY